MAIDSCKVYINGLRTKMQDKNNTTLEDAIFYNGFVGFQYKEHPRNRYLSYYESTVDGIYIKFFPFNNKGELRIKFNVPKLMAGTNVCSIFLCNTQQLFERLCFKLWPLVDLVQAPHLRFWYASVIEINADIIMNKREVETIYSVLEKTKSTDKYIKIEKYDGSDGDQTLYFIPKNAGFDTSDIVIKFYKKVPEMIAHNDDFNLSDVYNTNGIVNIQPQQSILRMEIKIKRDKIYKHFEPQIIYSSSGSVTKCFKNIGTFQDIFTMKYQRYVLNGLIEEFRLNKRISTPNVLRRFIRENKELSAQDKKDYWNVIQLENAVSHKRKPKDDIRNKCINLVVEAGYNYLYADTEVIPISIDNIISGLPEVQQLEIALYKNDNIFKDVQLSGLPNPRVYKGKHY